MEDFKKLIAHYDEEDISKKQLLMDHLFSVSKRAKIIGAMIGLENVCELQGYLHDFGKSSESFQLYIGGEYKGRVNHSSAGAKMLDYIEEKVKREYETLFQCADQALYAGKRQGRGRYLFYDESMDNLFSVLSSIEGSG